MKAGDRDDLPTYEHDDPVKALQWAAWREAWLRRVDADPDAIDRRTVRAAHSRFERWYGTNERP